MPEQSQLLVNNQRKTNRGFAAMDRLKQREIARKGGKAAHAKGTAHEFNAEEARQAGKKGGKAAHIRGTAHEFDSEEARAAGKKGGQARSRYNNAIQRLHADYAVTAVDVNYLASHSG
jgi:general stress protein YciG